MTTTIDMRPIGVEPIWVSVSASHVGILEIPGGQSATVILQWAKDLGLEKIYKNDDLAWCALYFWRLMQASQQPVPVFADPYDYLRALKVADYGQPLTYDAYGMYGVFKRPEGGHVGLIVGERGAYYYVRGGNQRNSVSVVPIEKARCVARRWAPGQPLPAVGLPLIAANGEPVSTNEA